MPLGTLRYIYNLKIHLENTSKANAGMQRQLCRGSIRKVLEKWPQRWQWCLLLILCAPLWRELGGRAQFFSSATGFGVTAWLMLTKPWHSPSEATSLSARKVRTRCLVQGLQVFTVWICNSGKITASKTTPTHFRECACRCVRVHGTGAPQAAPWPRAKPGVRAAAVQAGLRHGGV